MITYETLLGPLCEPTALAAGFEGVLYERRAIVLMIEILTMTLLTMDVVKNRSAQVELSVMDIYHFETRG